MKRPHFQRPSRTTALSVGALLALVLLALVLPGCGGVDSGGTGQTVQTNSSGRVSGFGSIIVNGIRFDDAAAVVVDDDGVARSRDDLRLGMLVEVEGLRRGNSGTGVADRIQYGNEIAGPVESVDLANARLVVLGQMVQLDADTLFEGYPAGLADVQPGHLVEVFAFQDASSGTYTATRLEREMAPLTQFELRGRISTLDTAAKTFSIGGALIDYAGVPPAALPTLGNGLAVRVTLDTAPVTGRWTAITVRTSQRNFPANEEAELEGHVSSFTSSANFLVAGVPVDARSAAVRGTGTLADLADGVRVEVEGQMTGGVLVATLLDFKQGERQEFELHGDVESVDAATQTLVVRGVTVTWDGNTRFAAGTAANLVVGAPIEVKGTPAGGVRIQAASIRFER